ncbi:unnamed protein product, partial [Mesorhabditis spiculigera]
MANPHAKQPSAPAHPSSSSPPTSPRQANLQAAPGQHGYPPAPQYHEPPPAYNAAHNYPTVPNYQPQQQSSRAQDKPPYPTQQPSAYPAPSYTTQNAPVPHLIYSGGYQHQSGGPPPPPAGPGQPPVVVQVVGQGQGVLRCAYCPNGVIVRESDTCCVVLLIILMLCTFPFGLLFLLCIPCAVHDRCHQCHRIG